MNRKGAKVAVRFIARHHNSTQRRRGSEPSQEIVIGIEDIGAVAKQRNLSTSATHLETRDAEPGDLIACPVKANVILSVLCVFAVNMRWRLLLPDSVSDSVDGEFDGLGHFERPFCRSDVLQT